MRGLIAWFGIMALITSVIAQDNATAVKNVLERYAKAVSEKDLVAIEAVVDTSRHFTVFEGGHVNNGWNVIFLFLNHQFPGLGVASGLKMVKINATGKPGCIQLYGIFSGLLNTIHQRFYPATGDVIQHQQYVRLSG